MLPPSPPPSFPPLSRARTHASVRQGKQRTTHIKSMSVSVHLSLYVQLCVNRREKRHADVYARAHELASSYTRACLHVSGTHARAYSDSFLSALTAPNAFLRNLHVLTDLGNQLAPLQAGTHQIGIVVRTGQRTVRAIDGAKLCRALAWSAAFLSMPGTGVRNESF